MVIWRALEMAIQAIQNTTAIANTLCVTAELRMASPHATKTAEISAMTPHPIPISLLGSLAIGLGGLANLFAKSAVTLDPLAVDVPPSATERTG